MGGSDCRVRAKRWGWACRDSDRWWRAFACPDRNSMLGCGRYGKSLWRTFQKETMCDFCVVLWIRYGNGLEKTRRSGTAVSTRGVGEIDSVWWWWRCRGWAHRRVYELLEQIEIGGCLKLRLRNEAWERIWDGGAGCYWWEVVEVFVRRKSRDGILLYL